MKHLQDEWSVGVETRIFTTLFFQEAAGSEGGYRSYQPLYSPELDCLPV
jgi:hypothetical protein